MLDAAERKKVVLEIQERLLELSIYPILFWDVFNVGYWKEVKGYSQLNRSVGPNKKPSTEVTAHSPQERYG